MSEMTSAKPPNTLGKVTGHKNAPGQKYSVGYGIPPEASRFKPGESGNPRGRPKQSTSLHTQITKILGRKIAVTEKGVARKMTMQEVMLTSVAANAAKGDLKAVGFLVRLLQLYENDTSSELLDLRRLSDDDQSLIAAFLKNNAAGDQSNDPNDTSQLVTETGGSDDPEAQESQTIGKPHKLER
jgi:Family of unknown function (DUF5681)